VKARTTPALRIYARSLILQCYLESSQSSVILPHQSKG